MTEFTLANGLTFIVMERHNAPVVSCSTYANVGAFDEEDGRTGTNRRPLMFAPSTMGAYASNAAG